MPVSSTENQIISRMPVFLNKIVSYWSLSTKIISFGSSHLHLKTRSLKRAWWKRLRWDYSCNFDQKDRDATRTSGQKDQHATNRELKPFITSIIKLDSHWPCGAVYCYLSVRDVAQHTECRRKFALCCVISSKHEHDPAAVGTSEGSVRLCALGWNDPLFSHFPCSCAKRGTGLRIDKQQLFF